MAYIGQGIKEGTFAVLDTSGNTYNGSNVTFDLGTQVGSPAQLLVSHDGVIQKPGTDYTLATGGTQITFSTAPASGASIFIVEISGAVGGPLDSDLNGTELILDADGDTSITADTDDQIDIKIAGADDFQFTANTFTAQSGSTIAGQAVTATTVVGSGAAQFATAGIGAAKDLGVGLHIKSADSGASVDGNADELVIEGSGQSGITICSANDNKGNIFFADDGSTAQGKVIYDHSDNHLRFDTTGSERMRITTGGNVGIADTAPAAALEVAPTTSEVVVQATGNSQSNELIRWNNTNSTSTNHTISFFKRNGTTTGSIAHTNNSTSFNTSSDYRLKENQVTLSNSITRLKTLKPYRFNFKTDADKTVDGFFAHEVSSVVPEAITGDKDAMAVETRYTSDDVETQGDNPSKNIGDPKTYSSTVIEPQAIDQAKLVPLLTKALQEAVTKIESLEARVTTLEG